MIIKTYRPDGSPDLGRWRVRCDIEGCSTPDTPLVGSAGWLIPARPDSNTYCPKCAEGQAVDLIRSVLHCPYFWETELTFLLATSSHYGWFIP